MSNLEIIRQAVIKSNPEIMELKFGCRVEVKELLDDKYDGIVAYRSGEYITCLVNVVKNNPDFPHMIQNKDIVQILGREIRLADVLLALTQDRGSRWHMITYKKWNANIMRDDVEKFINWDLKNDNLELQSEETIKFLAELLKL